MRFVKLFVGLALVGSLTLHAEPIKNWDWTAPSQYTNNTAIPASDVLTYTIYCSATDGGPYTVSFPVTDPNAPPTALDMAPVVNNQPGTYYCVATARSTTYNAESGYSNQKNFTVTAMDLGLVPKPPVLQ